MTNQKTILEICNFSSGISGTWTRVLEDAREFTKRGYKVHIFSSDETENGHKAVCSQEILDEGIEITRFSIDKRRGYALWFDFKEEAIKLNPDIIICHGLRKPYLGTAIKIARQIKVKCFLITHAPFIDKELRSKKLNFIIWLYDKFLGKKVMNSFDKVIAICKWEKENLLKLGCDEERIEYIPNSLSDEFFNQEKTEEKKKILYFGRMHPVKEIEVLIKAFSEAKKQHHMDYVLEIVSSTSGEYYEGLRELAKFLRAPVYFTEPIYDLTKKIEKIDSAEIVVLPSRKESLPFGLIEAMAREKIVVATKTKGGEELIKDCFNGFLFNIGKERELGIILDTIRNLPKEQKDKIREKARKTAEEFKISNAMSKWEKLFEK